MCSSEPLGSIEYKVGDKVRLLRDIYDDGEDHHPPGYIGLVGEIVVIRSILKSAEAGERIYVSHENITNNSFFVYSREIKPVRG